MTRKIHTTRPRSRGGRNAWDEFTRFHGRTPDRMWFCVLDYPVWVAQYGEEYDEWDCVELRRTKKPAT